MVRLMSERILLIGDTERELHAAVLQARPGAQVVSVASIFDGIAELTARPYTTVLAAAEPLERRPESAVRTLRELSGSGKLLLFGHPTLEPLSKKMLQFGIDDYVVTPTAPTELGPLLSFDSNQADRSPDEAAVGVDRAEKAGLTPPSVLSRLQEVPLADVLLDAMLLAPQDAPAAAVAQVNTHIAPAMKLVFTPLTASSPAAAEGVAVVSCRIAGAEAEIGSIHLFMPADEDESVARQFLSQFAKTLGKVVSLQDRHNRLQKLAITDELTGLYNGRYFRHYLNRIIDKARALRFPVSLLLFDIDNFKRYNDQYGHGVGDEILRQTAALMKRCVRDHDLVARISGDEFAVVFWEKEGPRQPREANAGAPGRPPQTPVQILERFRRLLATESLQALGPSGQGTLTISGGLAVYPYDAQTAAALIDSADHALMFKAKQSGKNSIFLVGEQPPAGGPVPPPSV